MGLRTSLERSSIDRTLPHNRPSKVDDWNNHNNDASREIGAAPHLSMGVDVWRNSSHASRPVAPPPSLNTQSDNPFDDPQYQIFSPFRRGGTIDMPTNSTEAHTHPVIGGKGASNNPFLHVNTNVPYHQGSAEAFDGIESQPRISLGHSYTPSKEPSISALPLHLPSHNGQTQYSQKTHRLYLLGRAIMQVVLLIGATVGFFLAYPRTITYRGMLLGNSLAFVVVWAVALMVGYCLVGRMSRFNDEREQWRHIGKVLVVDGLVLLVWLLVTWGNSSFAGGVFQETMIKGTGNSGKQNPPPGGGAKPPAAP